MVAGAITMVAEIITTRARPCLIPVTTVAAVITVVAEVTSMTCGSHHHDLRKSSP
jgi:hypothetical protein